MTQAYLLVAKLIPQPTWGGEYIAEFKGLDPQTARGLRIGQSYELATDSFVSMVSHSRDVPVELGNSSDGSTVRIIGDSNSMLSLQSVIDENPVSVLGSHVVEKQGRQMRILIKFTQAKGNSFQVHVKQGVQLGHWKPKPESWYFFEKGKATLGLKKPIDREGYRQVCKRIEKKAIEVSEKVKRTHMRVEEARKQLLEVIKSNDPFAFVNVIDIEKDTIVDLSSGGVHHSWEEGDDIPLGNIVYEVQVNVMDNDCTLRSFDKGKIAEDGTIRPIHIDDYFAAVDSSDEANDATRYMHKVGTHTQEPVLLFDSLYYKSMLVQFEEEYSSVHTDPSADDSFHHLFVKEGSVVLVADNTRLKIEKGASVFVPASTKRYTLLSDGTAQVIKTWV